jgi:hypothetical protein
MEHLPGAISTRSSSQPCAARGVANRLRDVIDVRGYTYWSALDNFEWMLG